MTTLYRPIIPNRDLERERALSKPSDVIVYKASAELAKEITERMDKEFERVEREKVYAAVIVGSNFNRKQVRRRS